MRKKNPRSIAYYTSKQITDKYFHKQMKDISIQRHKIQLNSQDQKTNSLKTYNNYYTKPLEKRKKNVGC